MHNGETVLTGLVNCDVGMVTYGRWSPKMFLKYLPKGPCRPSYVLLITFQSVTLVPVDNSTFLCDGVFVLWAYNKVFDGVSSFNINIDSQPFLKLT